MSQLSTHVLDTALGRPATGSPSASSTATRSSRAARPTRTAGSPTSGPDRLDPGTYRLRFDTAGPQHASSPRS